MSPPKRRSRLSPNAWKVDTQGRDPVSRTSAARAFTRVRISRAALFVKVTARMDSGGAPSTSRRQPIRCVMTRVLPEPAPASTRVGPAGAETASCWEALSPARTDCPARS